MNWKKEILSIPNLLSLFRLVLIPVYAAIYLCADSMRAYLLAASILAVSEITDFFDGKIARRFNMVTRLGVLLDPVADKATQGIVMFCLCRKFKPVWLLVALFVIKEGFMAVMGLITLKKGLMMRGAVMPGKICTTVLFVSFLVLMLVPNLPPQYVWLLVGLCAVFMVIALAAYVGVYIKGEQFDPLDETA